jgi:pimeloyl-ACP methyl ester carboxylesterase
VLLGGDWGAVIAGWMAHDHPQALLGIHLNMANLVAEGTQATTEEERRYFERQAPIRDWETGYSHQQQTRPQTLGVALTDSPVGAAAWILEKCGKWADLPTTATGDPDLWSRFTEEQLLTNIMLYVGPSTMVTATWIYHGRRLEGSGAFPAGTRIQVPMAFAAFPDPVFAPPPRSYVEKTFNVVQWTDMPAGGHFAAWEQPALMLADVRRFVAALA